MPKETNLLQNPRISMCHKTHESTNNCFRTVDSWYKNVPKIFIAHYIFYITQPFEQYKLRGKNVEKSKNPERVQRAIFFRV